MKNIPFITPGARDTSHGWIFEAYGTAGKNHCEVQALSGDIPAKGGHSWFHPGMEGRSVLPLREGVSHAHNSQASITGS
jgi:hypothetical protein